MKLPNFVVLITVVLILSCNSNNSSNQAQISDKRPDTIYAPCGFQIGMSELQIKKVIDSNPQKFYFDKSQTRRIANVKLNGVAYSLHFRLHRANLYSLMYISDPISDKLENSKLKKQYRFMCKEVEKLNTYQEIAKPFPETYKIDWPKNIPLNDGFPLASYQLVPLRGAHDVFQVRLDRDGEGKYRIDLIYDVFASDVETVPLYFD